MIKPLGFMRATAGGLLALAWLPLFSEPIQCAPSAGGSIAEESVEARIGHDLRSAIVQRYEDLRTGGDLKLGQLGNDITNLVRHYIDVGISFDEAERVLSRAGFNVMARPGRNAIITGHNAISNRPDRYDVYANSTDIIQSPAFGYSVDVVVLLRPKSPDDYSKVISIIAYIEVTTL